MIGIDIHYLVFPRIPEDVKPTLSQASLLSKYDYTAFITVAYILKLWAPHRVSLPRDFFTGPGGM